MSKGEEFLEFILDQFGELENIRTRRMFGAWGLYLGEKFFAIVDSGVLYFKTNPITAKKYIELEMKPFTYAPGKTLKNYYEVPTEILESPSDLCEWARVSASIG
jgi:DNA transformation protein